MPKPRLSAAKPGVALLFAAAAATFAYGLLFTDRPRAPRAEHALEARRQAAGLAAIARHRLAAGDTARGDGYTYTVDVAQLATAAALLGDRELFGRCRAWLLDRVVLRHPGNAGEAYRDGFVAWRAHDDTDAHPLDASGTTEALRAAEALWRGTRAFDGLDDTGTVLAVLDGYARHAAVDRGVWLIRNYFNLQTGAFSVNSYLVDYDVDFVHEVADATGRDELKQLAERCEKVVADAATPAGLVYGLLQPELATLMPGSTGYFAPNRVAQLSNTLTVLERAAHARPRQAAAALAFAVDRLDPLPLRVDAHTGQRVGRERGGFETLAPLVRLAVQLDDRDALAAALPRLLDAIGDADFTHDDHGLYALGEALLALTHVALSAPAPPAR